MYHVRRHLIQHWIRPIQEIQGSSNWVDLTNPGTTGCSWLTAPQNWNLSVVHQNCVTKLPILHPSSLGYSTYPQTSYLRNSWRGFVFLGMKLARSPIGQSLVVSQIKDRHRTLPEPASATLIVDDDPTCWCVLIIVRFQSSFLAHNSWFGGKQPSIFPSLQNLIE